MSNILYDLYFFKGITATPAIINAIASNDEAIYVGGDFTSYMKGSDLSLRGAVINSSNASLIESLNFNGNVLCSAVYGNSIYFGGSFTSCQGVACQNIIKINLETRTVDTTFDTTTGGFDSSLGETNTAVYALTIDAAGNIYVGGQQFNRYKGVLCPKNIAKLNGTTGDLDTTFGLNATTSTGFNSAVRALALDSSGNLYVGGSFTAYTPAGGSSNSRGRIAKLNGTTAALANDFITTTGFPSGNVYALVLDSNGNLYVGGDFTSYVPTGASYQSCKGMTKLNGNTAAMNPNFNTSGGFNGTVRAIALEPSTGVGIPDYIYAGGGFSSYNFVSRSNLIKLRGDSADEVTEFAIFSNTFTTPDLYATPGVYALSLDASSGYLYVGGGFAQFKGIDCKGIVKINKLNATADSNFDATSGISYGSQILTLARDSSGKIYAGGDFFYYKKTQTPAERILKISKTTNLVDSTFNTTTGFDSTVSALTLDSSGNVYVGGNFSSYKGTTRRSLAKLNGTTAALDPTFNNLSGFDVSSIVYSIAYKPRPVDAPELPDYIYVGGYFFTYKGTSRKYIAKIRADNADLDVTFDPTVASFNSEVYTLALDSAGDVYAGGGFSTYRGTNRQYIAKLNGNTAALDTNFITGQFSLSGRVRAIVVGPTGSVYAGGSFSSYTPVGGVLTTRQHIIKLNGTTAALDTTFNTTGFNGQVETLALDSSQNLYVGGIFTAYTKGTTTFLERLAKLNGTTADLYTTFDTIKAAPKIVRAIAWDSSTNEVYAGGDFQSYKTETYSQFVSLDSSTAAVKYQPAPLLPSITNVVFVGSIVVGTVNTNPTTTTILVNDQPLPTGSIVRNSTTGQKFIKIDGGATAFASIPITPPAEWNWSQEGINAWDILQDI